MLTCVIAYESNGHSNREATMLLINEFSGSLKFWRDHALTTEQKEAIKRHKTNVRRTIKVEEGTSTIQDVEEEEENAVETLLYTIDLYFGLGNDTDVENQMNIIRNPKCSSMRNFRWYNDMFLISIYIFKDCNARQKLDGFGFFFSLWYSGLQMDLMF